jgi:hypothetical protein
MAKQHGGTHHIQGSLHRGTAPKPSPYHHGSGRPLGKVHEAPTLPQINSANYAGHKLQKRK